MYATCLFCNRPLGQNEALERFPVGRRLAFDSAKGRLWVVCTHCAQWNLTPLEERYEAIEQAERLFRDSRLRLSTGNVGLARVTDGTDLVRIGQPQRPEMAAWRYGRQFVSRRRRVIVGGAVGAVAFGAASVLLPGSGLVAGFLAGVAGTSGFAAILGQSAGRGAFRQRFIRDGAGEYLRIAPNNLQSLRLAGNADAWTLRVPFNSRRASLDAHWNDWLIRATIGEATLTGPVALEAARHLLPLVNRSGARHRQVDEAVRLLEEWGGPERAFAGAASRLHEWAARQNFGDTGALPNLPAPVRLALEMSAHEEQEQRTLHGELAELERAWRDAEEIAAIADDLLLPDAVRAKLAALRGKQQTERRE